MSIALIYARSDNHVIGLNNTIPWHLPEDLARFKQLTSGCAVVMGRKTWDSLPEKYRPLPGRTNIVVTRQTDWNAEGTVRACTLNEALEIGQRLGEPVWVMGGAQIYAQALPVADFIEMTVLHKEINGDAYAPELDDAEWLETRREARVSPQGESFSFIRYERKR
ncbi:MULTISPECIES: dihydrofolate reductase [Comamonas]|uniref:dihydrofolate reductase n=1 Tax=Comamonas TaxID=283 RepID=UPI00257C5786|nr:MULTISPECIES: dihydrofolate reductase [Comamonas]